MLFSPHSTEESGLVEVYHTINLETVHHVKINSISSVQSGGLISILTHGTSPCCLHIGLNSSKRFARIKLFSNPVLLPRPSMHRKPEVRGENYFLESLPGGCICCVKVRREKVKGDTACEIYD
jgi:hypothetical protein